MFLDLSVILFTQGSASRGSASGGVCIRGEVDLHLGVLHPGCLHLEGSASGGDLH